MNEILINIISVVVTAVVLPLISLAGTKLIQFLNGKISNDKASKLLANATQIVINAVRSVFQTYVESLKADGKFDAQCQKLALKEAKDIALNQMAQETKVFISDTFGDLESWLTNQIEASINLLKNI